MEIKQNIRHLGLDELKAKLIELNEPSFRASQVWQWVWQKDASSFEEMTNLPSALRAKLQETLDFFKIKIDKSQKSTDGTVKCSFLLHDNEIVEGVLIPQADRMTACVSSQVGCSLSCAFCATGKLPRKRNLFFDEIYDQVVLIDQLAKQHYQTPLTNIVFMGMGEPLLNYSQVSKAIDMITTDKGLGMSPRRITVSTAGVTKMIRRLGDEKVGYNLAVSLHAANNEKRNQIMGINESNDLEELSQALLYFCAQTGSRVTFEYVMLKGFNDSLQDAIELEHFCRQIPGKINLIEYNPIEDGEFEKSSGNALHRFKDYLESKGLIANVRRSRGSDIDAACGQLANKEKKVVE